MTAGEAVSAAEYLPTVLTPQALREAAAACRGCHLYRRATQTVFGEGPVPATLMLVGEIPGDREDLAGRPFVGPAGDILDTALSRAGIDRDLAYLTNVVKHFKWEETEKRRLHQRPDEEEIRACLPWLQAELNVVRPQVLVALGATAAKALLGKAYRVSHSHGQFVTSEFAPHVTATYHPSAILRRPSREDRALEMERLVEDLTGVAEVLRRLES